MKKLGCNEKYCDRCIKLQKSLEEKQLVEYQLKSTMELVRMGMWSWDLNTDKVEISEELAAILSLDLSAFDNSLDYLVDHVIHHESRALFELELKHAISNQLIRQCDYRINLPQDKHLWVRLSGKLFSSKSCTTLKFIGIGLDVTRDHHNNALLATNLNFMRSLLEVLPNPIFYKDRFGVYKYCNAAFVEYLGRAREEIIDKTVYDIAPKHLADIYHQADLDLMTSRGQQVYEASVAYADQTIRDVIFNKAVHLDSEDEVEGLVGIMQDITDKKAMEKEIKMLHQVKDVFLNLNHNLMEFRSIDDLIKALLVELTSIFSACDQSTVLEVDKNGGMRIKAHYGFDNDEIDQFQIKLEESFVWDESGVKLKQAHIIDNIRQLEDLGYPKVISSDLNRSIESTIVVPVDIDDELKWVFTFDGFTKGCFNKRDASVANFIRDELPLLHRLLSLYLETLSLSRYDGLTGLMNRSYFDHVFDDRLHLVKRNGMTLLVVLYDLDGLKVVNDLYGHSAGDKYIKTFTSMLKDFYREADAFSRIGGDEFVGLFNESSVDRLMERILTMRNEFESLKITDGENVFSGSFSFGISSSHNHELNKTVLLNAADERMYLDKNSRR
ncbi:MULTISPECIES: sensor domain-containing diguanylate cyclase [unclassified Fusibacter]|uniref:sensor domain-containing diguanylate cyclase n=1 Tax=unclassified Fusibacter TaxID=2624464 RepID=UPI00101290F0|nr:MULTISPECIES: diguanylate cyclase [unclassified Fusibacter]MCK8060456.1 diguanylate cyclase [Fusibacter sp. A2]NPE20255.1 diguanylate cyclase [Fusibacter sp. A1]RXV63462.1 sensor domain-containing diguanylate cyclase [Fusibacter sp. A1]